MSTIALAGRRIDPLAPQVARFPLANVPIVRERLEALFYRRGASMLVCSAACGADLIALEVARALGLRCRIVLPFAPERFRQTSVVDRPGDWNGLFDRIIAEAKAAGDLVVLRELGPEADAYAATNLRILDEALVLAGSDETGKVQVLAVIVWEGGPRGVADVTKQFADDARRRGLEVIEVQTV